FLVDDGLDGRRNPLPHQLLEAPFSSLQTPAIAFHSVILRHPPPSGCELGTTRRIMTLFYFSTNCTTLPPSVVRAVDESVSDAASRSFFLERVIQPHYIDTHRSNFGNAIFSVPYPGCDLSALPQVGMADIINLHWVAGYQSPITLHKLFATGKPVIWTLHDQWAFTGGCHYTAGCEKFQDDCVACPQLTDDEYDVAAAVLKDRRVHLRDVKLVVVTPSRWLASC